MSLEKAPLLSPVTGSKHNVMAWISSAWERIAVGETHSGSITSQKEEKVAMNVSISSFYMYHSPAKERLSIFWTGASPEADWDQRYAVCTKTTHGTQFKRTVFTVSSREQRVPKPLIV